MVTYVKLPKLTWTMEQGFIGKWLRQEGETIQEGDPLCQVETEKTTDEIKAPESGVLYKIIVPANRNASVDQILAVLTQPNEQLAPETLEELNNLVTAPPEPTVPQKPPTISAEPVKPPTAKERKRIRISPLAKKLAEKHGIDVRAIAGTGPGERIVKKDVEEAIQRKTAPPSAVAASMAIARAQVIPFVGKRKVIADRLSLTARNALLVPLTVEVDMTDAAKLRGALNAEYQKKGEVTLSYTAILVKAVATALQEHPIVNAILEEGQISVIKNINIGVAVSVKDGLVVPVVRDADKISLLDLAVSVNSLVEKARGGTLLTREASGGTFTLSNLGMFNVDLFAPIINPPESAILGVGRITKKPVVVDDAIVARLMMTLTLVFDHRVMDGTDAARFLQTIKQALETPHRLL